MSLYLTHYIGPILLAKQHPEEQSTWYRACSNTKCNFYRKQNRTQGKHCHECGSVVKNYQGKPQTIRGPRSFEVQEKLKENGLNFEALWLNDFAKLNGGYEDFVIYMPNNYLGSTPPAKFYTEEPRNCTTLISQRNPDGEIKWFECTYQDYISILNEMYDETQVHWAILNYQS